MRYFLWCQRQFELENKVSTKDTHNHTPLLNEVYLIREYYWHIWKDSTLPKDRTFFTTLLLTTSLSLCVHGILVVIVGIELNPTWISRVLLNNIVIGMVLAAFFVISV